MGLAPSHDGTVSRQSMGLKGTEAVSLSKIGSRKILLEVESEESG
jgi:hypothetical protein